MKISGGFKASKHVLSEFTVLYFDCIHKQNTLETRIKCFECMWEIQNSYLKHDKENGIGLIYTLKYKLQPIELFLYIE